MRISTVLLVFSSFMLAVVSSVAQTWTPQQTSTDGGIRDISFLDEQIGVGAVWVLPGSAAIIRTSDGGASWTTTHSDINEGMTGAAFPSLNSPVVVGGTFNFGRIYTSANQGLSWSRTLETSLVKPSFWCLDFPSAAVGYAGGGGRTLFSTINGGASWGQEKTIVGSGDGQVIALHFMSEEIGWAITTTSDQDNTNGRELLRTTDGGKTWSPVGEFFVARSVYFVDQRVGYVAGYDGRGPTVWRTVDSGKTWNATRLAVSDANYLHDVTFATDNPFVGYLVGGDLFSQNDGIIARTTDGGATWEVEEEGLPVLLFAVDMPQQRTVYASGSSGFIYKTTRTTLERPEPTVGISAEGIDFDSVRISDSRRESFVITSASSTPLEITSLILDPSISAFRVTPERPLPVTLAQNEMIEVTVEFLPVDPGPESGVVRITTNDPARLEVSVLLSGIGKEGPDTTMSVRAGEEGRGMTVAPNPARERIGVEYVMGSRGVVQLRLFSLAGELIRATTPTLVEKGMLRIGLSLLGFTSGLYLVEIVVEGEVAARKKFVVQQ